MPRARLEVWGDPIAHSLSPRIHAAAYAELDWDWSYGRRQVGEEAFAGQLAALDADVHGLSLTYPLKGVAHAASTRRDRAAELTGAVNTLLLTGGERRGFNTDVAGLVADLREQGVAGTQGARIVGAGATATSALVALGELGATRVDVVARRPEAAAALVALGERAGISVEVRALDDLDAAHPADRDWQESAAVTVSTLPGGTALSPGAATALATGGGLLYDVVYGQWPTPLATAWEHAGGRAVNGLGMLLQQAVRQIRIFATGEPDEPLPREDAVVAVMRRALMGD